jgi:hypothetical protein
MNTFQRTKHYLGPDHDDPAYAPGNCPQDNQPTATAEQIFCRVCDTPTHLAGKSTTCPNCGEEILSRRSLLDLIRTKQDQVNTLVGEIGAARTELHFRKLRAGEKYFWEQPKPAYTRGKQPTAKPRPALDTTGPGLTIDPFDSQGAELDF